MLNKAKRDELLEAQISPDNDKNEDKILTRDEQMKQTFSCRNLKLKRR